MRLINLNIIVVAIIFIISCASCRKNIYGKEIILLSQKSLDSLGYLHLIIFEDSTFQYLSIKKLKENIFTGKVVITQDTIYMKYTDTISNARKKVFYTKDYLEFVETNNIRLETKFNKLK